MNQRYPNLYSSVKDLERAKTLYTRLLGRAYFARLITWVFESETRNRSRSKWP